MAVTMKNDVFWDVTSRGSCKNRRFGGAYRHHHQVEIGALGTTLAVTSNGSTLHSGGFLEGSHGVTFQKTAFFRLCLLLRLRA
jgi:hypothetical protein